MSDLELLLRSSPGRAASPVGSLVRDLTEADLHALHTSRLNTKPKLISRIRNSHHALARLVAVGIKNEEISRITGFSPSWISTLSNQDPAFKNLVEYYREQIAGEFSEVHVSLHERLTSVAMLAAEELQERLTNEPESLSASELNDLVKSAADRTGFGPQTKSTNVNVNIDLADRLEAARKRAFGEAPRELNPPMPNQLPGGTTGKAKPCTRDDELMAETQVLELEALSTWHPPQGAPK